MKERFFTVDGKPIVRGDQLWCFSWKKTGIVTREIAGVRSVKVVGDEWDYVNFWADRDEAVKACLKMVDDDVSRCQKALDAAIADRDRVIEAMRQEA